MNSYALTQEFREWLMDPRMARPVHRAPSLNNAVGVGTTDG